MKNLKLKAFGVKIGSRNFGNDAKSRNRENATKGCRSKTLKFNDHENVKCADQNFGARIFQMLAKMQQSKDALGSKFQK